MLCNNRDIRAARLDEKGERYVNCNYFEDFKANTFWENTKCILGIYACFMVIFSFLKIFYNIIFKNYLLNWKDFGILSIISIGLIIGVCWIGEYSTYVNHKKAEYATFKFEDLKKWYAMTPEKFIFENNRLFFYYVHEDNAETEKYRYDNCILYLDTTIMYPETFFDAGKFAIFVNKNYFALLTKKKKAEEQKARMKSNEDTMRVMNSLKKDLEKIMEENQRTINEEFEKIKNIKDRMS